MSPYDQVSPSLAAVLQSRSIIIPIIMIIRALRFVLQLIYALLLLVLLCLYGCVRGFSHLLYRSRQANTSAEGIQEDLKSWNKIPAHLAITFVPSGRARLTRDRLAQLAEDASECLHWAAVCDIKRLSFFDPEGLMQEHAVAFKSLLAADISIEDASARPTFTVAVQANQKEIEVYLVAPKDGKAYLAETTSVLADAVSKNLIKLEDVDVPLLNEKLDSAIRSPQLMIVLGGRQLKLHGYPPWHIRLTEIYHEPSLGLLGPARLTYGTFKRAMNLYSGCEMRFGR